MTGNVIPFAVLRGGKKTPDAATPDVATGGSVARIATKLIRLKSVRPKTLGVIETLVDFYLKGGGRRDECGKGGA